jgi:hypothetical protein
MAQRNVTEHEVRSIVRHRSKRCARKALHVVRRRSDIAEIAPNRRAAHCPTNVVVVIENGWVVTIHRNDKPFRHIGK